MKRTILGLMALVFLSLCSHSVLAEGWSSRTSVPGSPKFGDHLKKGKVGAKGPAPRTPGKPEKSKGKKSS